MAPTRSKKIKINDEGSDKEALLLIIAQQQNQMEAQMEAQMKEKDEFKRIFLKQSIIIDNGRTSNYALESYAIGSTI